MTLSPGRVAAIACVATFGGFVGGAWFVASGVAFDLIPVRPVGNMAVSQPERPGRAASQRQPVKAVGLPVPMSFGYGSGGLPPRADRVDLLPAPGCSWAIEPRPFRIDASHSWHVSEPERALGGYATIDPLGGGLRLLLVQSIRAGVSKVDLRPVFFDAEANRQLPRAGGAGSSSGSNGIFTMTEYWLDPVDQLAADRVAYFGIERVVPDAARQLMVATQREALEKGMTILPPPALGQAYRFDLPTADGKRVKTDDFHGKALLVVVGAPNGMAAMTVENLRKVYKPEELAVVGVSFDGSVEDARASFARAGSDLSLVVVPNDVVTRRIWLDGAEILRLPAYFVIDRDGILRFTCNFFDIQDRIDILFGRAKRPRFQRAEYRGTGQKPVDPKTAPASPPAPPAIP